jgi:hypothetical protein
VVCSACAFENQAGMRFCGMCGMPLPQRPITAPGAQSTLNFTRVPVDARTTREQSGSQQQGGGVLLEMPRDPANGTTRTTTNETSNPAIAESEGLTPEPPVKELVPDVPLDEYVQKFHYQPPEEPAETTMHGDAHVAAVEPPVSAAAPAVPITRANNIVASSNAAEVKPPLAPVSTASTKDVDARLGLEPETPTEARVARPRFLDINEPPKEKETDQPQQSQLPANSGTTISGPSFLGLSDRPQTFAAAVGVEEGEYAPRNYHWRAWFAVAIVLVFVALGVLEWRAQVNQTQNGPVEVIRTRLRKIGQSAMTEIAGDSSASTNNSSKPEMQVQEQPHAQPAAPHNPDELSGAANTGSSTSAQSADQTATNAAASNAHSAPPPASSAPTPTTETGAEESAKAPDVSAKKPAVDNSAQQIAATKLPTAKNQADKSSDGDASAKGNPGADEMMKAKNASDSAAEAAWLWKATAKGNPDAPVQLADMYIQGDGVPRSCEQAMVLLKTAAEKENARARNRLASMYATGTCVQRNRVEAYRWMSSALTANPNSEWAQQNRDLIWQQMTPDERAMAQKYR